MLEITHISKSGESSRSLEIIINDKKIRTPCYFPSVSSYGARFSVDSYVDLIVDHEFPRLLISCYDLNRKPMKKDLVKSLNKYSKGGNLLFLDSGIYESSWKRDRTWSFDSYRKAVSLVKCDLFSSFDIIPEPNGNYTSFVDRTIKMMRRSQALESSGELVPIVHGKNPKSLFSTIKKILRAFDFELRILSIPERETGSHISERANFLED